MYTYIAFSLTLSFPHCVYFKPYYAVSYTATESKNTRYNQTKAKHLPALKLSTQPGQWGAWYSCWIAFIHTQTQWFSSVSNYWASIHTISEKSQRKFNEIISKFNITLFIYHIWYILCVCAEIKRYFRPKKADILSRCQIIKHKGVTFIPKYIRTFQDTPITSDQ